MTADAIHPTALVDPAARLAADVRIGPFSIVGPDAVLGPGTELGAHVIIEGRVELEAGVKVGHGSILGGVPQDLKYRPEIRSGVRVGAGTVIREHVVVHRSTQPEGWTVIGPECLLMAMCHVAHDCRIGQGVILINYAGVTGHCEIGDRAIVGGLTGIAPFMRIGTHAYIGGVSKVTTDVPPYMLVEGIPVVARGVNVIGLRRAGMRPADRRLLQDAYRLLYREGLSPRRALERIRAELPPTQALTVLTDFIAGARRGICRGPARGGAPADTDPGAEESVV
jgi:UDP-N-acetylglucosamine acyltransferase